MKGESAAKVATDFEVKGRVIKANGQRSLHIITDAERISKYGACETCGGPRDVAEMMFADGAEILMLICLYHPSEHDVG